MFTLAELLESLSIAPAPAGAQDIRVRDVCIDSRQAQPGALFVALRGERTDGHRYVEQAFAAGALAALVEHSVEGAATIIDAAQAKVPEQLTLPAAVVVPDSLRALQRLAQAMRRKKTTLQVVAVTGSMGKTTTKEAIGAVLAQRYTTLKSQGNYNNEIGLPLTLLQLSGEHTHAVLEMGMYALGEIAALCKIAAPQIGVVTNVAPVHLERLGSMERIAAAKAELVEALPPEGLAVLNGDDARVAAMRSISKARVVTFGQNDNNGVWADQFTPLGWGGSRFRVHIAAQDELGLRADEQELSLMALGAPMMMAALPAVAIGRIAGLSWEEIQRGLLAQERGLRLTPRRGLHGSVILDDSYNASPAATIAALDVLASLPGRRIAVLGDMLELGSEETPGHRQVGEHCAHILDMLITVGERARIIAASAREAGLEASRVHALADSQAAIALLSEMLQSGDIILVKGSRSMGMESIVQALAEAEAQA